MIKKKKKATILVVEDRVNWHNLFCKWLKGEGLNVIKASNAKDFTNHAPNANVIFLDITIPLEPGRHEQKAAGLHALAKLQETFPNHAAIHNPIIRSMWRIEDFSEDDITKVRIDYKKWCSREKPIGELMELIRITINENK